MTIQNVRAQIRFQLEQLKVQNKHHYFEDITREFSRQRICRNLLPATGPVGAGGDQGRDFETYNTFLDDAFVLEDTKLFEGGTKNGDVFFACSLKQKIFSKIKSDVNSIFSNTQEKRPIVYFCVEDLPIAKRNKLINWCLDKHGVDLQIFDGQALSENLSDPDIFWIAEQYLHMSSDIYPASLIDEDSYNSCREKCVPYLRRRFEIDSVVKRSPMSYSIQLSKAIIRNDSAIGFREWWKGDVPLLFVEGEEGCGKSWIMAQEAWKIAISGDALVLWLDSIHWQGLNNIRGAVETAFQVCLGVPDSDMYLCQRLYQNLELRWKLPILLVLDGMNEKSCPVAAERIIGSLLGRSIDHVASVYDGPSENIDNWRLPKSLRVVFSTRSLSSMPGNPLSVIGERATTFVVLPYSEAEFMKVLSRNSLTKKDLPKDAAGLLYFPRLFSVFLRVKSRMPSVEIMTPAVIWWYDLLAKIETGLDPVVTNGLKLINPLDAKELLSSIAEGLSPDGALSDNQLNSLFGGQYLELRSQLLDSKMFKKSGRVSAMLSDDHVALAWGLLILRHLQTTNLGDVLAIADRIHELLEPGLSDSRRTLGILVALQLSLAGEATLSDVSVAGGILAWFCSHNIFGREDQLDFWCKHRLNAYGLFIEDLLISPRAGSPEKVAVAPLARLWRSGSNDHAELASILRRWLLVTWSEGQPVGEKHRKWEGIQLPVVPNNVQLRLTPIAISILSQKPDESMLPILAECYASANLSIEVHGENRFPAKWPYNTLKVLMRWIYTESFVPALQLLYDNETRSDINEAYQWLITEGLGIQNTKKNSERIGLASVEESIRKHGDPRLFMLDNPRSWVHNMELLAVRDDLPEIIDEAKIEIMELFRRCCNPENVSIDRWFFDGLWSWALKLDPEEFESICVGPLERTLAGDALPNYEIFHHFQGFIWHHENNRVQQAIDLCVQKHRNNISPFTSEMLLEWILLHGGDDQIIAYLVDTENFRAKRGYLLVDLMSITELLRMLKPACVVSLAQHRAITICEIPDWRREPGAVERMEYWLTLWSNAVGDDDTAAKWAIGLLTQGCPAQCRDDCIRLLARSATSRLPSLIRDNPELAVCLQDEDFVYMLRYGYLPEGTVKELMMLWASRGTEMLAHSGRIFLLCQDDEGFRNWGQEILWLACQCAAAVDGDITPKVTRFELSPDGCVIFHGPVDIKDKSKTIFLGLNSWGRNADVEAGCVEDANVHLAEWQASEDALQKWKGFALRDFNDEHALLSWAERYPCEFKTYCDQFFKSVLASQGILAKMGVFPHCLLSVMLRLHPIDAYAYWERLRSVSSSCVYTICEAELVPSTTWLPILNRAKGISHIRRATLVQADNDEVIMGLALYAIRMGSEMELFAVCELLLESKLSKDRALAVSVIAWLWGDSIDQVLNDLFDKDPSCWVRDHVFWALGVRRQDVACRNAYRRALGFTDEYAVSRELHIMKPALLPSCMVWREIEEEGAGFPVPGSNPRKEALIRHFWRHWDCVTNHRRDTKVRGRRMKEYLRGHKVDRSVEEQMAPWWNP